MMSRVAVLALALLALVGVAKADECVNRKVSSSTYTPDSSISTATGFIASFSVSCDNWKSTPSPALYWLLVSPALPSSDGRPAPAVRAPNNHYQVSWTEETPSSGERKVLVYTEEGYTALRKALRSGESIESITPLLTISIPYSTGYTGPTVSSEVLATLASIVVAYLAIRNKSKLVS